MAQASDTLRKAVGKLQDAEHRGAKSALCDECGRKRTLRVDDARRDVIAAAQAWANANPRAFTNAAK